MEPRSKNWPRISRWRAGHKDGASSASRLYRPPATHSKQCGRAHFEQELLSQEETTMIIDTADLDPTSSYKLLIGSVLPRAIAWVSTSSTSGVGNIAPVSFFTVVGRFPPVLSITLQPRSDGVTLKDTFVNIRDTGEFVVNIASIAQADAVHRSAYEFDTDVDEFEALGMERGPSVVNSPTRSVAAP